MHEADKVATALSAAPRRQRDTSPRAVGAPSGIPSYDDNNNISSALSLHAPPLLPLSALPLHPHLAPPPWLQNSLPQNMSGAGVGGDGVGVGGTRAGVGGTRAKADGPAAGLGGRGAEEGGQVMVHWTQSGPSVQPTDRSAPQSADEEDDEDDDDDDELLTPPPPRERLSYTRYQLELLNGIYISVRYPNSVQKQLIAKRVGISREQVKIWFQNRRRKDVVNTKGSSQVDDNTSSSSTQDLDSPANCSSPTEHPVINSSNSEDSSTKSQDVSGGGEDQGNHKQKSRMVPDAVIHGCIAELKRFSDQKLKERKEKRKAKGRRRTHAAAPTTRPSHSTVPGVATSSQSTSRLFQAYDMVAPPNKVTPTAAYLNTSANRFNHSHNTSAFSNPRDHLTTVTSMPRLAWEGLDAGFGQSLSGGVADQLAQNQAFGGLGMASLGVGLMPMSQSQGGGVNMAGTQESLPVLSDLLSYRQQTDACSTSLDNRETSHPQQSLLPSSCNSSRDSGKLPGDFGPTPYNGMAVASSSSFGLSRVYPFPFIADPPIMLSSLHQQDHFRHAHHWPHPHSAPPTNPSAHFNPMATMNGMDPYKPVMISSFSNPFFSHSPQPPHWSQQVSGTDPASGNGFPQN